MKMARSFFALTIAGFIFTLGTDSSSSGRGLCWDPPHVP